MKTNQFQNENVRFSSVKIERIVPDGYGIGFAEGLTFFVPLVAVGDFVKVKIDNLKGKIAFASLVEILEPSPHRIEPPCPYFGRCGGCDFQQMNYAAQLAAKVGIIKDCLRRIAKIDWQSEIEIIASPHEWNYRTRAQWKRENQKLGYFNRNSHRVCDVGICPILSPALQAELIEQHRLLQIEPSDFSEIQAISSGGETAVSFDGNTADFDENFYAANKLAALENVADGALHNQGSAKSLFLEIADFTFEFSTAAFFQVNHEILPQVLAAAMEDAVGELALDLYCGVGLFALPLAKKFRRVVGVEGNPASIKFAGQNADRAKLENVTFETAKVSDWLKENAASIAPVDLVLLDPPRTGAERETIESLIALRPNKIVYVSCNPATLARDLRRLTENAFSVKKITAFDFFPQTHHVETIVHLAIKN